MLQIDESNAMARANIYFENLLRDFCDEVLLGGLSMAKSHVALLLESLDEGFAGPAWHGPSLRAALRGVTPRVAAARTGPRRHNIWEIALHAAYWKYAVRRRLTGEKSHSADYVGRNWFVRPGDIKNAREIERAWQSDLALLAKEQRELKRVVAALKDSELDR